MFVLLCISGHGWGAADEGSHGSYGESPVSFEGAHADYGLSSGGDVGSEHGGY